MVDEKYLELVSDVLENGRPHEDRTGVGTLRVFGRNLRFDLSQGFPLLTTKRVWFRGVFEELNWFLSGNTNIQPLVQAGVSIWTDWPLERYREETGDDVSQEDFEARVAEDDAFAEQWGDLGPVYGKQWRDFEGPERSVDQIERLIDGLKNNPSSRRHVVSAWHPAQIEEAALPPCHFAFQCFVESGKLSLQWQQRSVDVMLGFPWNIASYALLTHFLADQAGLVPSEIIFSGGDVHIYQNHVDGAREQLTRKPRPAPDLTIAGDPASISGYSYDNVSVNGYNPHPSIDFEIAV